VASARRPFPDRFAGGLVAVAFVSVPLACSPAFWDQFTNVKWYVLDAVAVVAAALFAFGGAVVSSRFVRTHWPLMVLLAALAAASALRTGPARAVSPLLDRLVVVTTVALLYAHLERRRGDLRAIAGGVAIPAALTVACVIAQHLGHQPLGMLTGGDSRSAFFGNVNIAAEFLGLAAPLLLWARACLRDRGLRIGLEGLLAAVLSSIVLLGSRSVILGMGVVLVLWLALRAATPGTLARVIAGAAVLTWALTRPPTAGPPRDLSALTPQGITNKAAATSIRIGLWTGSLRMIRDQPLGVGAANFADRFVPYQLVGLVPDEHLLYRWPHNEWLRVPAEDGLPFAVTAALALVLLGRAAARSPRLRSGPAADRALLASTAATLIIESLFQFPFAMAPAALMACLTIAYALWAADSSDAAPPPGRPSPVARALWGLAAMGAAVALVREARSDYLLVHGRGDGMALRAACRLEPRRVEACMLEAWQQIRSGDRAAARGTLARILERSPYYYPAIKLLGQEALSHGQRQEGCLYLWMYDGLFVGSSSVHATVAAECPPDLVDTFRARVRMPRYEEFPLPAGVSR
jgi:hypothetical protein